MKLEWADWARLQTPVLALAAIAALGLYTWGYRNGGQAMLDAAADAARVCRAERT